MLTKQVQLLLHRIMNWSALAVIWYSGYPGTMVILLMHLLPAGN